MTKKQEKLISASEVAAIWNERAKEMGYHNTNYTRWSVRSRRNTQKGEFKPALVTHIGTFYREQDAWSIPLFPQRSHAKKETISSS